MRCGDDAGIVIAPNHPTMLDAVLIMSRLPRVVCITKAALWDNWALGGGIRLAGYMPQRRAAADDPPRGGRRCAPATSC